MKNNCLKFLVELSDKRNAFLMNILNEKFAAAEFSFVNMGDFADKNDTAVIFSPARKLGAAEAAALPQVSAGIGGKQPEEIIAALKERGITYINLIQDEDYAVKNALLTAEGALYLMLGGTDKSIFENSVLILGCGRVGKATALLLQKLGVNTAVATFDKAEYDTYAFYADKAFFGREFIGRLSDYDVIINTIPARILDEGDTSMIRQGALVIELASENCMDKKSAEKCPFSYIQAGGLPAKYSAESAARIMYECICKLLKGNGDDG